MADAVETGGRASGKDAASRQRAAAPGHREMESQPHMTTTERDRSIVPAQPNVIADAVAAAIGRTWWDDAVMIEGWALGARAFAEGAGPRGLLADLAELEDRALEAALAQAGDGTVIDRESAVDALRRIRAAAALLHAAAMQGFTHAARGAVQADARAVRHALKNPIGAIRNALSLLHEGTVAPSVSGDADAGAARLHAIALRATGKLETLVRERLSGASAADALLGLGTPLRDLIARVVRDVGGRAGGVVLAPVEAAHADVLRTRAPGVDLVLRSVLIAAVRAGALGTRVGIDVLRGEGGVGGWIQVRAERVERCPPDLLDAARELARLAGLALAGSLEDGGVCVESGSAEGSGPQ